MTDSVSLERSVPVLPAADVCVVGGGPAGVAAAIGARRCGKSVLLVERTAQLGGMATVGSVAIWMPIGTVTGFYEEMCRELSLSDSSGRDCEETRKFAPLFSPFEVRHYLNRKLETEGVVVHFHMEFVAALKDDASLTHLFVSTREGLRAVAARQFIDCTGDARVAADAGVPVITGRESDGATQPMTLMFIMQDTGRSLEPRLPDGCPEYNSVDELPQGRLLYWEDRKTGTLLVNMTRVRGNAAMIDDVSRCEREALAQMFGVVHYLQRTEFPTYILAHVGAQTGVRQTGQIVGEYTLSEEDLLQARRFADVATQTNYGIDIHNPDGTSGCEQRNLELYDIPYRCLVPKGVTGNLLVAGRCLSATRVAMSSARVMPSCFGMGQAAGVAASLAMDTNSDVGDIDIGALHDTLHGQGVRFHGRT